jgi:hypothetical protein
VGVSRHWIVSGRIHEPELGVLGGGPAIFCHPHPGDQLLDVQPCVRKQPCDAAGQIRAVSALQSASMRVTSLTHPWHSPVEVGPVVGNHKRAPFETAKEELQHSLRLHRRPHWLVPAVWVGCGVLWCCGVGCCGCGVRCLVTCGRLSARWDKEAQIDVGGETLRTNYGLTSDGCSHRVREVVARHLRDLVQAVAVVHKPEGVRRSVLEETFWLPRFQTVLDRDCQCVHEPAGEDDEEEREEPGVEHPVTHRDSAKVHSVVSVSCIREQGALQLASEG